MNRTSTILAASLLATMTAFGQTPKPESKLSPELAAAASATADKGIEYLRKNQAADGGFAQGDFGPSVTALALTGLLKSKHVTASDPMVAKGFEYLSKFIQKDGGIYPPGGAQRNYSTAISILAFAAANQDKRHQKTIDAAVEFLKKEQWDESEGIDEKDARFGGAGYGGAKKTRPDLSNTTMMLDALKAANLPEDDPAYKKALIFIRRCQNYSEEGGNDLALGMKINDGGFYYTPVEDYNPGGKSPNQGLRSYGSMTYAGLKSFIHAGLKKDDPRVKAAVSWVKKHYTLKENPGMGQEGLFYYYHTFAKALDILGIDTLDDANGVKHDWRADLIHTIQAKQKTDGSWTNESKRWFENNPNLVTAYMLLALGQVMN